MKQRSRGGDYSLFCFLHLKGFGGFPGGSDGEESAWNAGDLGLIPELGKIPWRREWLPTPVFLPGESHGQRSLVGYSPWGCKELGTFHSFFRLFSCIGHYRVLSRVPCAIQ